MMHIDNIRNLNNAQTALYQLELVQEMAKNHQDNKFPIQEYAFLIDSLVQTIKNSLEAMSTIK
ncbi:hypothetical protein E6P74_05585 [Moraxella lacunata]|uniref:Uncharacterized protein n=1 Tax=Moraxella lacunata TaxID=477 RepID=A0A1B8Q8A9_MORLA|nr:hypothetical protein [Moraxella lacunata]MDI4482798.1 hypothetical protein [Moraxella lacunata]MDI4507245.1 hypothetical protein [Moraxella lacunata]OBX61386.1 hypothetical protein A9Z63_08085 [Moraxella lacunata]OBX67264.1 hypothetical protein A9309_01255 [Moraxella lacunata]